MMNNGVIQPNQLFRGGIIIIAGDSRSELSLLARQTAVELATGNKWIGLFPVSQCRVLYLELQASGGPVNYSAPGQSAGTADRLIYLKHAPMTLYTATGMNDMACLIQQYKPEVVIIDCLSDMVPTILGPKIKRVMINLRSLAKQYAICFVLLHSLVKGNWESKSVCAFDLRGDSIIAYEADLIIALTHAAGRSRQLHTIKTDFSPIEKRSPMFIDFRPESDTPFVPSGKSCEWVKSI